MGTCRNRASRQPKTARFISVRLVGRLNIQDAALRENMLAECLQLSKEMDAVRNVPGFSADQIWKSYTEAIGFRLALSASQSLGIAAAYNTYENFLVRCVSAALGMPSYRKRSDEKFVEKLTEAFGPAIADECFTTENVQLFRLLRHAIAHNGGRETPDLAKLGHPFEVTDKYLQIMPQHLMVSLRIVERCVADVLSRCRVSPVLPASAAGFARQPQGWRV